MFDKLGQAAERLATHVSRRAFLGRLGKGALVMAGVLGSVLAFGGKAQALGCAAGLRPCGLRCCLPGDYCCLCNVLQGPFCSPKRLNRCRCYRA
jgi:hypothetical protein